MNHKALGRMRDVRPVVVLANAIARRWPARRPLEFVHAPFAAADEPAPTDVAFYAPLVHLKLPAGTRFVAGFVHEDRDLACQRKLLTLIEQQVGHRVDVAASCGLGRRNVEPAVQTMDQAAALAGA